MLKEFRKPKKAPKSKLPTKKDIMVAYGLPSHWNTSYLRYKNPIEKGIYWHYLSRFIRERDCREYGTCISCGKEITFETCQAGHFMPAVDCGPDLVFDVRNVNAECARCNSWDETHLLGYAENLDKRYGEGTARLLRYARERHLAKTRISAVKDYKSPYYKEKIIEVMTLLGLDIPSI